MYFPLLSLGEILKNALLNTILGMGVVFSVLIFISLLISLLAFIPKIQAAYRKKTQTQQPEKEPENTSSPIIPNPVENMPQDDLELIAVISAAIAASTGMSEDDFVVRSIRRSNANNWNKTIEI